MLKFQWNALRLGHLVSVHDRASPVMALIPGTVVMIELHRGRGGVNGVGIRVLEDDGLGRVVRPSYLAVHPDPDHSTEPCWRCDEIAGALRATRQCGRCRMTFPGDPTLAQGLGGGWWACPPCHELLLGSGAMAKATWPAKTDRLHCAQDRVLTDAPTSGPGDLG